MSRDSLDRYYTPQPLADRLVPLLPIRQEQTAWEPAAGGGAFVIALQRACTDVMATDLDPAAYGSAGVFDFLSMQVGRRADWIVTNPPEQNGSKTATLWCEQAIRHSRIGAALLVRSAVYQRLSDFALDHCVARYALKERPEFEGPAREGKGAGARYDYDFLVFSHARFGPAVSRCISWR